MKCKCSAICTTLTIAIKCTVTHRHAASCSIMQLQLDQCWRKEVVECSQTSQSHYNIKVHNTIGLIYYRKGFNDKHCTITCAHIGVCSKLWGPFTMFLWACLISALDCLGWTWTCPVLLVHLRRSQGEGSGVQRPMGSLLWGQAWQPGENGETHQGEHGRWMKTSEANSNMYCNYTWTTACHCNVGATISCKHLWMETCY